MALASMGVYIFETEALVEALEDDARQDTQHDFGKNIIPAMFPRLPVYSYRFYDENQKAAKYWRDIGTLDAYYEANMDLCQVNPEFNLYDPAWPLRTYMPQAPPAKFVFNDDDRRGMALDSIISSGCIVSGSKVVGSVLCPNVRVHSYCTIENSILMPGVRVGRHSRIRNAIIDRDVLIPRGAVIGYHPEEDRRRHTVSDGGVVVVTVDEEPLIGPVDTSGLDAGSRRGREGARGLSARLVGLIGWSGWIRSRLRRSLRDCDSHRQDFPVVFILSSGGVSEDCEGARPRDSRLSWQPDGGSGGQSRRRRVRPCDGAVWRVDRRAGSARTARRRQGPISRQGCHQGGRQCEHRAGEGSGRQEPRPAHTRRRHDRARRHADQESPRRQRAAGRLDGVCARRGRGKPISRCTSTSPRSTARGLARRAACCPCR